MTALRRVHDVVLDAGGITARGSTRRVLVTRRGVETAVDLLAFQLRGDLTQNPAVRRASRFTCRRAPGPSRSRARCAGPASTSSARRPRCARCWTLAGGVIPPAADNEARLTRLGATAGRQRSRSTCARRSRLRLTLSFSRETPSTCRRPRRSRTSSRFAARSTERPRAPRCRSRERPRSSSAWSWRRAIGFATS